MLWYVRQDHTDGTTEKPVEGTKLRCPLEHCPKSYKMHGWLARHKEECCKIRVEKYERQKETETVKKTRRCEGETAA